MNIVMKINPGAPVYVFTFQARNDDDETVPQLTPAQIEAARNAAVSVLELLGATVDATSSALQIGATETTSKLVLSADVQPADSIPVE